MRIAVIGTGVSGLVAAALLRERHDVVVFERSDRIGGHVHTVDVADRDGIPHAVDTGFIVFNEQNYPLFTKLLSRLGVPSQPSDMSFSVRCDRTGLEYNGSTFRQLFAQRRNLFRPAFHRMLLDILRFNRRATADARRGLGDETLATYLEKGGYGRHLADHYLVPMGSALWSMPPGNVLELPIGFFVGFFDQHGMLTVDDRPQWRVVQGGSRSYVDALIAPFRSAIRTSTPVRSVRRARDQVLVDGERFDHVVFGCHSDEALYALEDPTDAERRILGAMPYASNDVVLHTDTGVLPRRPAAWGAWNYQISADPSRSARVTYNMNLLQSLRSHQTFCVTLNRTADIDPRTILFRTTYRHPQYTVRGFSAQARYAEISGGGRTHYCGAYWGYGFHEDGVRSAVRVASAFGISL
jgi:predicted NAD/FAD-binding protein